MTDSLGAAVGALVRLRREQRGLSAAELARRAGLSKAALSGIEAGGNPTLDTLDALANALAIPLVDLLDLRSGTDTVVVRAEGMAPAESSRRLLHRLGGGHSLESWRLQMVPGEEFAGVPHAEGTVEQLLVLEGSLTLTAGTEPHDLAPGDFASFAGDRAHAYAAGPQGAIALVLIASPRT